MKAGEVFLFCAQYCHNTCCLGKLLLNEVLDVFLELVYPPAKAEKLKGVFVTSRNRSIHFSLFYPMLTFSLRLMVTHRLDSCDHLLYRLVTWYVPCLYCCRDAIVPCDLLSHVDGL